VILQYKKYVQGIDPAAVALRNANNADFQSESEGSLNSIHFLVMGATAKFMSTTITYPLQVLRARMFRRDMPANTSMLDVTKFVHSSLGVRGFYQGFVPYVILDLQFIVIVFYALVFVCAVM
jgi:hypothetical protein